MAHFIVDDTVQVWCHDNTSLSFAHGTDFLVLCLFVTPYCDYQVFYLSNLQLSGLYCC